MGKRFLLATAWLMLAALFALPGVAAGQGPPEDSVVGFAFVTQQVCYATVPPHAQCLVPDNYYFDVHSGPAGESPRGTVVFSTGERVGLRQDRGSVTCLAVNGSRASIGVNFSGLDYENVPHAAVVFVEDNGGAGQDRVGVQDLPAGSPAPNACPASPPAGVSLGPTYTINFPAENMGVTDALVLPTSKDQCKHGGWRNFGTFNNQGQCIRFVTHQARQACIFERAAIGRPAFRVKYGEGRQHRHALRNCVRERISG